MASLHSQGGRQQNQVDCNDKKSSDDEEEAVAEGRLSFRRPLLCFLFQKHILLKVIEKLKNPAEKGDQLADASSCVGNHHENHAASLLDCADDARNCGDCRCKQSEASSESRCEPKRAIHEVLFVLHDVHDRIVCVSQTISMIQRLLIRIQAELDVPELILRVCCCISSNERDLGSYPAVRHQRAQEQPDDDAAPKERQENQYFRQQVIHLS